MPNMPEQNSFNLDSVNALSRLPADDWEDLKVIEKVANEWFYRLEQVKWPRGLQYFENVSYLSGNHLTRFYYTADSGFGFHHVGLKNTDQMDNLVAKVADNRLIRPYESVIAMLNQERPTATMEPNSDSPEDEDAARIAELVWELVYERPLRCPERFREAAGIGLVCGTVAAEVEYGDTDIPVETPVLAVSEDGISMVDTGETTVELRRDLQLRMWTPYHLNPDPVATGPHDMTWIGRNSFEDVEWVVENYARDEDGFVYDTDKVDQLRQAIAPDSVTKYALYWWAKFQDIIESPQYYQHGGGLTPQTFTVHGGSAPGQCVFSVLDVRPSVQFPRGRTIILAGGTILYVGDARSWSSEYPDRWHPYSFWSWLRVPGRFWGIPMLSQLIPLQKKINAIDSLVMANRQFMAIGQWKLPKHSKVPEGRLSGIPGENFTYTAVPGMSDPERVNHVPLPQELLVEREQLLQSMDYIAATGATDGNQVAKSAARAGVMLEFLQRQRLQSKTPMLQDWEAFIEGIAQNALIEIQLNLVSQDPALTSRIAKAAREESSMSLQSFTGASLRDHHAIKIDIVSALLQSKEAMAERAMQYLQFKPAAAMGGLGEEENEAVLKATGLEKFVKTVEQASVKRARRMVSHIINGRTDAAYPMPGIDNPRAMAPVFQRELLAERFVDYEDEVQQALLQMFQIYSQLAAQEAQAAAQQAERMAGSGVPQESSPAPGAEQGE